MKNRFQEFIKECDIFGQSVRFNIMGENQYKSIIGGITTLVLSIVAILVVVYFSIDMIWKQNPNVISYQNMKILQTNLSNQNFFAAFDLRTFSNNTRIDFSDTSEYFRLQFFTSSDGTNSVQNISKINCSDTFLYNFSSIDPLVINDIVKNYTCIDLRNVNIQGDPFHTLSKTTLMFSLSINYYKLMEKYKDNIDLYNQLFFPINVNLYYQSHSFDPDNYDNPFQKHLSKTEVTLAIENYMYIYAAFKVSNLTRDDSIFFSSKNNSLEIGFKNFLSNTYNFIPQKGFSQLLLGNIYIDSYQDIFIRSYLKIQDIAASASAIIKILASMINILLFIYTHNRINEKLALKFYKYQFKNFLNPKLLFTKNKLKIDKELNIYLPKINKIFSQNMYNLNYNINKNLENFESKENIFENNNQDLNNISRDKTELNAFNINEKKKLKNLELNNLNHEMTFNNELKNNKTSTLVFNDKIKVNNIKIIESNLKIKNKADKDLENYETILNSNNQFLIKFFKEYDLYKQDEEIDQKLSFRDSFRSIFKSCFRISNKLKEKLKFYQIAEEKIKEKLDIITIFKRLEELDNLKILSLNSFQNLSLKYCKKPNILNFNSNNIIDKNEQILGGDDKNNLLSLLKYFLEKIQTNSADNIDKKLLEMLEPELLNIIYAANE